MTERYFFVIYGDEDGGHVDGPLTEGTLLERLQPEGGYNSPARNEFLSEAVNFDYWPERGLLVIEGKIVKPRPKRVVMAYKV